MSAPAVCELGVRACKLCREPKPLSEFSPGQGVCKSCRRERNRRYRRGLPVERVDRSKLSVSIGQRFGHGVVTETGIRTGARNVRGVRLRCDCGNLYEAPINHHLIKGVYYTSCGCAIRNRAPSVSRHPLYRTWNGMIWRCENPHHPYYSNYGGRGISVTERWHDVLAFISDIERDIGPRPAGMTLDRWPDNDGDYEPGNVRWATMREQCANRRESEATAARRREVAARLERGEDRAQIARALDMCYSTIWRDADRLRRRATG